MNLVDIADEIQYNTLLHTVHTMVSVCHPTAANKVFVLNILYYSIPSQRKCDTKKEAI